MSSHPPLVPDPQAGSAPTAGFLTVREALEVLVDAGLLRSPLRAGMRVLCGGSVYVTTHLGVPVSATPGMTLLGGRSVRHWQGVEILRDGRELPATSRTKQIPVAWILDPHDASTKGGLQGQVDEALQTFEAQPHLVADDQPGGHRAWAALRFLRGFTGIARS